MKKLYINEYLVDGVKMADAYCNAKSALWNRFFGWRKVVYREGEHYHLYLLPKAVTKMFAVLVD